MVDETTIFVVAYSDGGDNEIVFGATPCREVADGMAVSCFGYYYELVDGVRRDDAVPPTGPTPPKKD